MGIEKLKHKWKAPDPGWIKINVVGAYSEQSEHAGIGVVIRNSNGKVLLSAWRVIFAAVSAEEVEALACKEGVALAVEWASEPVILESDCAAVIQYIKEASKVRPPCLFTILEAKRLAESLRGFVLSHVRREQNVVAHELAQVAKRLNHTAVWCHRSPTCIEHLVAHDCKTLGSNQ
ncbi:uncharacterized protein [Setaria viridis]|uniref:uncharacterized protein n=1 Tax=Setaria viridis TaxID=4556 RepID=UPI003B3B925B